MIPLLLVVIAAFSYFIGTISSGRVLAQFVLKKPVRKKGYIGYETFDRQFGRKWAAALLACDVVKTAVAVLLGGLLMLIPGGGFPSIGRLFAGMCVVIGDIHPYQTKLHGGHGVACMITALWLADWRIGLVSLAVLAIVAAITQYLSLACVAGCFTGVLATWVFIDQSQMKGIAGVISLVAFLFVIWRYRANITRLIHRSPAEPKLNWGRRPESRLRDEDF